VVTSRIAARSRSTNLGHCCVHRLQGGSATLANPRMPGELGRAAPGEDWRYLQADDGRLGLSAGGHALRTLRRWAAQRACAPVRWGAPVQRACDQLWLPLLPVRLRP